MGQCLYFKWERTVFLCRDSLYGVIKSDSFSDFLSAFYLTLRLVQRQPLFGVACYFQNQNIVFCFLLNVIGTGIVINAT